MSLNRGPLLTLRLHASVILHGMAFSKHQRQLSFRASLSLSYCGMLYRLPLPLYSCLPLNPAPRYFYYDAHPRLCSQLLLTRQHGLPPKPSPVSGLATTRTGRGMFLSLLPVREREFPPHLSSALFWLTDASGLFAIVGFLAIIGMNGRSWCSVDVRGWTCRVVWSRKYVVCTIYPCLNISCVCLLRFVCDL